MNSVYLFINRVLLKADLLFRASSLLSCPIELQLEPTNRCNLACVSCARGIYKRPEIDMSYDDFKSIIGKFPYVKFITLHGLGEPLLTKDLSRMISYAHSRGVITAFATNGLGLNPETSIEVIEASLDKIYFSVDRISADSQDPGRGVSLDMVAKNIECLQFLKSERKSAYPSIGISTTITKENLFSLDRIIIWASKLNILEVSCHLAHYLDRDTYAVLGVTRKELKRKLRYLVRLGVIHGVKVNISTLRFQGKLCATPWHMPFIAANGDVFACCYQREPVGNILRECFSDLWNNELYRRFRSGIKSNPNDICKNCPFLKI